MDIQNSAPMMQDLQAAGAETGEAIERFCGNQELYEKFLLKFLEDQTFSQIGPALANEDWETAKNAVHTLKGVSSNLGLNPVWFACASIHSQLCAAKNQEAIELYPQLADAYAKICQILKSHKEV